MMFIGNLNYVAIAVVGGLRVASGAMQPRRRAGVHPVLAAVHPAADPGRRRWRTCCSPASRRPSGSSSCSTPTSRRPTRPCPRCRAERRGRVEFEHVSFRYEPDQPLIEDLSLVAEPGQTVAIVGPTGAGKTTLVNLIMRFYELDAGRITLDGVDIATMTRDDLRSRHRDGAAGHLAVRRHDPRQHRLRQPGGDARSRSSPRREATYVDRFVRTLPDGYDTVIDEEGSNVSAGREAADHDRAGVPRRPVAADPRRGHQLGRHPHRGAGPAGDGRAAQRPHELRDRPPAVDDPRRRPDPRDGGRADRRAGHPRGAARGARRVLAAVRGPVRGERHLPMRRDAITAEVAARLVAEQFPAWARPAGRPGRRERLGQPHLPPRRRADRAAAHRRVVRGGRREGAHVAAAARAAAAAADPGAAGARGARRADIPWPWSVRRWIDGRPAAADRIADPVAFADDLARFLLALWGVDAAGGPAAGAHSFHRGGALAVYDEETRAALATLGPRIDAAATGRMWEAALAATSDGPAGVVPRRRRGGQPAGRRGRAAHRRDRLRHVRRRRSRLRSRDRLDAVRRARAVRAFVEGVGQDAATWARARGWALWKALITLAAPDAARRRGGARRTLARLLTDPHPYRSAGRRRREAAIAPRDEPEGLSLN